MKPNEADALAEDFCEFLNFREDVSDSRNRTRFFALGLKVGAIDLGWPERSKRQPDPASQREGEFRLLQKRHSQIVKFLEWLLEQKGKGFAVEIHALCDFTWDKHYAFEIQRPAGAGQPVLAEVHDNSGAMRGPAAEKFEVPTCLINFLIALNGRPVDSFQRCPWCKKIFFNPSKRVRLYCSSKCQNTAAVSRARGKREG